MKVGDKVKFKTLDKMREEFKILKDKCGGFHANKSYIDSEMFHIFGKEFTIDKYYNNNDSATYHFAIYDKISGYTWACNKNWIEDKPIIDVDELFKEIEI